MNAGPRLTRPREPLRDGETALRAWREDDVPALVALCRDPEIVRWIGLPADYGESDARAFIADSGVAERLAFAITGAEGELLGSISLLRFCWDHRRGEVGYWLGAPARGRGHATRAVGLACGWGFRGLGLERVALLAAADNLASQRVAEHAGFTLEARLRAHSAGTDGREDMICFSRLATDP